MVGAAGGLSPPPPKIVPLFPPPHPHIKTLARKTAVGTIACARIGPPSHENQKALSQLPI